MQVYKVLAGLDFSGKIFEAKANTALGNELLNKYRTYVVANPATCGIVNNFLREARGLSYDKGIQNIINGIMETIDSNRYGWALASVCESISNGNGKGNYLQLRAVEQVEPMLEMKEDEIVSYIKSGALKSVMYVEAFRNIAKSVYKEQPVVECSEQYTAIHPIAFIVEDNGTYTFHAAGCIFRTSEDSIYECDKRDVSQDFLIIANMLESGVCKYNDGVISMELMDRTYKVFEENEATKCTITKGEQVTEYTVEQLRENNNYIISATPNNLKSQRSIMLESFAKIVENFDHIAILNNVSIINNNYDKFLVIENNKNAYAKMLRTNHSQPWEVKGDITKVVETVKKYTRLDITKLYEQQIGVAIEESKKEEGKMIQENLMETEIEKRKAKIAELTEKYKNDPTRLEMLSQVASELSKIN